MCAPPAYWWKHRPRDMPVLKTKVRNVSLEIHTMKKVYSWFLVPFFLFCMSFPCAAASIRIRVINCRTGKPLQKQEVSVALLYGSGEKAPASYRAVSKLETDANGEARLGLPDPPPEHLSIVVHLSSGRWHCGCLELTETQKIIQNGIIAGVANNGIKIRDKVVKATPGEVLFTARPLSLLEELLYPLVKG